MIQDRKMYQGNWKCSKCGTEITELPFEPKEGLDILCKDCHREKLDQRGGGRRDFQRKMYQETGNVQVAEKILPNCHLSQSQAKTFFAEIVIEPKKDTKFIVSPTLVGVNKNPDLVSGFL